MKSISCLIGLTFFLITTYSCSKEDEVTLPAKIDCTINEGEQEVIDDLNSTYAHKFDSSSPEDLESDNLGSLINYLGEAQFVGMGEATHGTAEFYQMKDKIFRNLVEQKDFNAIIFELPWGNALKVNDYVKSNIGDLNSVIDQTGYWVYDTQEVRDLASWIHTYNLNVEDDNKLSFVGCDVQGSNFTLEVALINEYLKKVEPDSVESVMKYYENLPVELQGYGDESTALHQLNIEGTFRAYDYILQNRDKYIQLSEEYEYEVALMASHVIKEREFVFRTDNYSAHRDMLMAFYSEWWQRILGDDSKVAIWAHNGHVADGSSFGGNLMGTFLSNTQNDNYRNVGFSFGKGRANAFVAKFDYSFLSGVRPQSINEIPCNTSNFIMSEVDGEQFYLIFDELEGFSKFYFDSFQPFLQFGAGFNPTFISNYIFETNLVSRYDVMVHFDETNASILR